MNFGISTMPFEDYQLKSKLTLLKEAGIKNIEVKPKEGHFNYHDPKYLDEMSKEFKRNGIKVISMHMPTHGADISLIEEYDRVWSVREVEKTALALLRLGGEILVVHPGSEIEDGKTRKARREKSEQSLEEILKFCEHWGIKIALENTLPGKTGDSIPEILEIVRKFNSKNLGICLDTGHCNMTSSLYNHSGVVQCLPEIKDYLCHLHSHDNFGKRDDHSMLFEGNIDWKGFVKALKEINYQGVFMFELRKKTNNEEMLRTIKKSYLNLFKEKKMTDKKGHLYWLRRKLPDQKVLERMDSLLKELNLHTVCNNALCPNRGECFKKGTATFMILGNICTRNCKFCAVEKGKPLPLDPEEPHHIAQAAKHLNLKHIVVTSVTRDDLSDGGAEYFAWTIVEIRKLLPESTIEMLIPDFEGSWEALQKVIDAQPEVINHNIETVARLYKLVRPKAVYKRSLELLRQVKIRGKNIISKSGIMVGLGEEKEEVIKAMKDLREVDCDILTIGQYLKPSPHHIKVSEYIHPDKFEEYQNIGMSLGFKYVASDPLVRSSYHAGEILKNIT